MKTTIVLPVSRPDNLPRVFAALELMTCDAAAVTLLAYVDGDDRLHAATKNYVEHARFATRLCLRREDPTPIAAYSVPDRRRRIAAIHNELRALIPAGSKYVFGVEDDTVVPPDALVRLQRAYSQYPFAGLVSGVELGRWGIPHVGLWTADDVYEPKRISTPPVGRGVEYVDASGFYCFLTRRELYVKHEFKPYDHGALGPDVDYGLALRRQGLRNYVDWGVQCEHRRADEAITLANTKPQPVEFMREDGQWKLYI